MQINKRRKKFTIEQRMDSSLSNRYSKTKMQKGLIRDKSLKVPKTTTKAKKIKRNIQTAIMLNK